MFTLQLIIGARMLVFKIAMKLAMFPRGQSFLVGSGMLVFELVVNIVVPVFQLLVLTVMPAPAIIVMGQCWNRKAAQRRACRYRHCQFTHTSSASL